MSIAWDKRHKRWRFYFDRTIDAQRARSSKLLPAGWSHAQARAYDKAEEARLYALASGIERIDERPPIARAVQLYLDHRLPELRNAKKCAQDLAQLVPWIEGRTLQELPEVAREYRADNPKLAAATVRNRLAYLKAAVRYAYRKHGLGDRDYTERMELPSVRNERQIYLEPGRLPAFVRKMPSRDARDLFTLAFATGLRWRANLLPLTREQIVRRDGRVWLSIPDTKNGRPLMIPVHEAAQDALRSIPFRRSDTTYYAEFNAARAAIRRPELRPHDLRHSLASALASDGASLPEIGAVLGHKSVQATKRYAHLYPQRVEALVNSVRFSRTGVSRGTRKKAA